MAPHSFIRYLSLSAILPLVTANPQAPIQAVQSPVSVPGSAAAAVQPSGAASGCGGCVLVADVAALVWYSQVFVNPQTELVGVNMANSWRVTRTSLLQNEGVFSYTPGGNNAQAGLTQIAYAPSATVGGAILTSPTAYNVFTGYTITSIYQDQGQCVTSTIVSQLPSAYTETLSQANGQVVLDANGQRRFIDSLGFSTCSGGGENFSPTALLQVTNSTTTTTTTFANSFAQQNLTISTPRSTPATSTTLAMMSFPSVGVPNIVIGNNTITPTPQPIGLPTYNSVSPSSVLGYPGPTNSITPFVAGAGTLSTLPIGWIAAWVAGLVGFGAGIYYM